MRLLAIATVLAAAAAIASPPAGAAVEPIRWCGNDRLQTDRAPDRMGGPQIHVVYAIPSDGEDRFDTLASPLATDVAAVAAWWQREDQAHAPRFDLFEFPSCESRYGLLDLTFARLPQPSAAFGSANQRFAAIADTLSDAPFELNELDKKYLVFYDGAVEADDVCGTASGAPAIGGQFSYAVIYLRSSCGATIGRGLGNADVAAHEMLHLLGALPGSSPNECPDSSGHVCDSSSDLLWPYFTVDELAAARLDVGRDDYYGHSQPSFDVQDSGWLLDPAAVFPVMLRIVGAGIVGSEPDGQGCRAVCTTEWSGGRRVQLAAEPDPGFAFTGWGGPCAGQREPSCLLEVAGPAEVIATFRRIRTVTVAITGRGVVSAPGVRCSRSCRLQRLDGERLSLRATAAPGWRFVRWSGGCRGTRPSCTVKLTAAARVAAVFARRS